MTPITKNTNLEKVNELIALINSTPIDEKQFRKIRIIFLSTLQFLGEQIKGTESQYPSYSEIFGNLAMSCAKELKYNSEIADPLSKTYLTMLNVLRGVQFFSTTLFKWKEYLNLGELYATQKIDVAEGYAKQHALDPTYAHTVEKTQYGPRPMTAVGRAGYHGNIELVRHLASRVDLSFEISNKSSSISFALPHHLTLMSSHRSNETIKEILGIFNKHNVSYFQRNPESWGLCPCINSQTKPEKLHAVLEGAPDLLNIDKVRTNNKREQHTIVDAMIMHGMAMRNPLVPPFMHKCVMESIVVLISFGGTFNPNYPSDALNPLQITQRDPKSDKTKTSSVTFEAAKTVYDAEKAKFNNSLNNTVTVWKQSLSQHIKIPPVVDLITGYAAFTERGVRILIARNCFKNIFGYHPKY